jgi:hypothetical protein
MAFVLSRHDIESLRFSESSVRYRALEVSMRSSRIDNRFI